MSSPVRPCPSPTTLRLILTADPSQRQTGIAVVYLTRLSAKCDADVATAGYLSNSCIKKRS
jgi:hypothetical protein